MTRSPKLITGKGAPSLTTQDFAKVPYLDARTRLLAAAKTTHETEWLIQVGRYVQHCWLAEEQQRGDGEFMEMEALEVWDTTELAFREIRARAAEQLVDYKTDQGVRVFVHLVKTYWKRGLWWHVVEIYKGGLGAVGIIAIGLFLTWFAPEVVRAARFHANEMLPPQTRPTSEQAPPVRH